MLSRFYHKSLSALKADSLYRNSFFLLVSNVLLSGFGFIFWVIAAHAFTAEQVGLGSALIAVVSLLSSLGQFGFNTALIRFLPRAERKNDEINTVISLTVIASMIVAVVYVLLIPLVSPKLGAVHDSWGLAALFVGVTILASLNALTDSIFIAYRKTVHIMTVNGIVSVLKLALPFALVGFGYLGVFGSYAVVTALSIALSFYLIIKNFQLVVRPLLDRGIFRKIFGYSVANHTATFLGQLPMLILPILVLQQLGAKVSAYYYLAMMLVTFLNTVPQVINQSLLAEGSHHEEQAEAMMLKALRVSMGLMVPVVLAVIVLGPYLLMIFGREYADGATAFLRLMALTSLFLTVNYIGNTYLRILKKSRQIVMVNGLYAAVTIAGTLLLLPFGLVGIGIAMLASQAFISLVYLFGSSGLFKVIASRPAVRVQSGV